MDTDTNIDLINYYKNEIDKYIKQIDELNGRIKNLQDRCDILIKETIRKENNWK